MSSEAAADHEREISELISNFETKIKEMEREYHELTEERDRQNQERIAELERRLEEERAEKQRLEERLEAVERELEEEKSKPRGEAEPIVADESEEREERPQTAGSTHEELVERAERAAERAHHSAEQAATAADRAEAAAENAEVHEKEAEHYSRAAQEALRKDEARLQDEENEEGHGQAEPIPEGQEEEEVHVNEQEAGDANYITPEEEEGKRSGTHSSPAKSPRDDDPPTLEANEMVAEGDGVEEEEEKPRDDDPPTLEAGEAEAPIEVNEMEAEGEEKARSGTHSTHHSSPAKSPRYNEGDDVQVNEMEAEERRSATHSTHHSSPAKSPRYNEGDDVQVNEMEAEERRSATHSSHAKSPRGEGDAAASADPQERSWAQSVEDSFYGNPERRERYNHLREKFYENGQARSDADGLKELWYRIGATEDWEKNISGEDLSLLLCRNTTRHLTVRVESEHLKRVHAIVLPEEELKGFISVLASRLPLLRSLRVLDSPISPYDFEALQKVTEVQKNDENEEVEVSVPFRILNEMFLSYTKVSSPEIVRFTEVVPSIGFKSFFVNESHIDYEGEADDSEKLLEAANGKMWLW